MKPSDADLALVRGLVEIPSVSRREGEAVEWLVARMAERGFRASVDDAGNAVGADCAGQEAAALVGEVRLCVRNHLVEKLARQEKTK